jgi:hypothetical protein
VISWPHIFLPRRIAGAFFFKQTCCFFRKSSRKARLGLRLARSVLRYAFHCERAEGRVLPADLLLRIAGGASPRLDFVHVLELENDDGSAGGWPVIEKVLLKPANDVFAPIVIDGLLRPWEEVFFVTVLVRDGDFINNIGGRRYCSMQAVDRASA